MNAPGKDRDPDAGLRGATQANPLARPRARDAAAIGCDVRGTRGALVDSVSIATATAILRLSEPMATATIEHDSKLETLASGANRPQANRHRVADYVISGTYASRADRDGTADVEHLESHSLDALTAPLMPPSAPPPPRTSAAPSTRPRASSERAAASAWRALRTAPPQLARPAGPPRSPK